MTHWLGETLIMFVQHLYTSLRKQKGKSRRRGINSYLFFIQGAFVWASLYARHYSRLQQWIRPTKVLFPWWSLQPDREQSASQSLAPEGDSWLLSQVVHHLTCNLSMWLHAFQCRYPGLLSELNGFISKKPFEQCWACRSCSIKMSFTWGVNFFQPPRTG